MKTYSITEAERNALLSYLVKLPWDQTNQWIQMLSQLPELEGAAANGAANEGDGVDDNQATDEGNSG